MKATLSQKETRQVIASLEKQGARVNKTKNGVRVLFPNGSTTAIHWTTSDYRAAKNMRADIKRAGLTWPFDNQRGQIMNTKIENTKAKLREAMDNRIKNFDERSVTTAAIAEAAGVSEISVLRHMPSLGYESKRESNGRSPFVWAKPDLDAFAADPRFDPVFPEVVSETEPSYPEIKRASSGRTVPSLLEINPRTSSMVTAFAEGAVGRDAIVREGHTVQPQQPQQPGGREFIDTAESWTIEVPEKLQRLAERLGLNIEVRVWRDS